MGTHMCTYGYSTIIYIAKYFCICKLFFYAQQIASNDPLPLELKINCYINKLKRL